MTTNDMTFWICSGGGVLLVVIGIVAMIVTGQPIIAEGYEDEEGFHYGKPK